MTYEIATVLCGGNGPNFPDNQQFRFADNRENEYSPCECYQSLLSDCTTDVQILIHDDVSIHDADWIERVMALFDNPQCVAVGLGGAIGLGHPDLYKRPYSIWNMARRGYASNQTDAEVHGARFTGTRKVAVLDAFCLAIRTGFLRGRGGWPVGSLTHHCLDLWLACEVARAGKETWMVGVSCTHHGGGTSVTDKYSNASWLQGGSMQTDHTEPHLFLYNAYRDVLPIRVPC